MRSVLILTPWFPNRPGDRQGNFIYDSAAALVRAGLSICVLVTRPIVPSVGQRFRPDFYRGELDVNSFKKFQQVRQVSYISMPRNYFWHASVCLHDRAVEPALKSLAIKHKVDAIHAHTESEARVAVRVGGELGLPVFVSLHGINYGPRYFGIPGRRKMFGKALRAAKRVILVGEPLRSFFQGVCGSSENFRVVPNGVDLPHGFSEDQRRFNCSSMRFISVSNLEEGKGIDVALCGLALARKRGLENWNFTTVGDGTECEKLVDLSRSLGLSEKVHFLGNQPHERIYELLNEADVFILPSYREAFGIAYLEAMACGLVAIGVRGQGPEAFIEHGNTGFLVEPKNPHSIADYVLDIAAKPLAMRQMGLAAAASVRDKFTWDEHARRLLQVYYEVVQDRPNGSVLAKLDG